MLLKKLVVHLFLSVLGIFAFLSLSITYATDVLIPTNQIIRENKTRYFLIGIGINNFADDFWPSLKWPVSDATRVSDKLGQDTNSRIVKKLLIGESATLDKVSASLSEVAQEATAGDVVVLYVSSHGILAQNADGTLERIVVLQDSKHEQLFSTGLSHNMLQKWLDGLKSRKKMMIFATCHSGEGKSRLPPKLEKLIASNKGKLTTLSDVSEGALVLAAAAKGEAARENDDLQGDIYTHYFLEALTIYDRNRDGMVSALEAHDYARDRTWAFTKGQQRPTANAKLIGDADIPLYGERIKEGLAVLEAYDEKLAGFYLQVGNGEKGRLPFAFPLTKDKNHISLFAPGNGKPVAEYSVTVNPGNTVTLDQVMYERPISIGLAVRRENWSDETFEKLSSSIYSTSYELNALFHMSHGFGVGLMFGFSQKQNESETLLRNVDTSAKMRSIILLGEYRYDFDPVWLGGRLEMGQEWMKVRFTDNSTGAALDFESDSFAYGGSLVLGYTVASDFSIVFEMGFRRVGWDLGIIGELQGDRQWLGLGIDYRFGSVARTMW